MVWIPQQQIWTQQPQYPRPVNQEVFPGADILWNAAVPAFTAAGPKVASLTKARLVTNGGLAISGGYVGLSAIIPSMYSKVWTEVGCVRLDGYAMTTVSARPDGQTIVFNGGYGPINLVMWLVADVTISAGALPIGVVNYAVRRNGSQHVAWINGKLYGSATNASAPKASTGALTAIGAYASSGAHAGLSPLSATQGILAVGRTPIALPDAACCELSRNPWQIFAP
jgi:hypothetical protein